MNEKQIEVKNGYALEVGELTDAILNVVYIGTDDKGNKTSRTLFKNIAATEDECKMVFHFLNIVNKVQR